MNFSSAIILFHILNTTLKNSQAQPIKHSCLPNLELWSRSWPRVLQCILKSSQDTSLSHGNLQTSMCLLLHLQPLLLFLPLSLTLKIFTLPEISFPSMERNHQAYAYYCRNFTSSISYSCYFISLLSVFVESQTSVISLRDSGNILRMASLQENLLPFSPNYMPTSKSSSFSILFS